MNLPHTFTRFNAMWRILILVIGFATTSLLANTSLLQQPPTDTEQYLYALGEGFTAEQARNAALAELAARLNTRISSSFQRNVQDVNGLSADRISAQIHAQSAQTELAHFEIIARDTTKQGTDKLLIRLDRAKLANHWQFRMQQNNSEIVSFMHQGPLTSLTQWHQAKRLLNTAEQSSQLSFLLFALIGQAPGPDIYQALQQHLAQHQLAIQVTGRVTTINRALELALSQQGLAICQRQCREQISYQLLSEDSRAFGEFINRLTLELTLTQHNQAALRKSIQVQASSVSNAERARALALSQLEQRLSSSLSELLLP